MNMLFPRVGIGHDTHKLIPGEGFRLGGVFIPYTLSLQGHSDADVLLHAVTDALLGAVALGDIGELFPDDDPENRGRNSADMLKIAYAKVKEQSLMVGNLDCIIFAQRPKLKDFKAEIAEKIAEILEITSQQVGIKAKTGEGVGIVGEEIVIEAQCVVLLIPARHTPANTVQTLMASRSMTNNAPPPNAPPLEKTPPHPAVVRKTVVNEK